MLISVRDNKNMEKEKIYNDFHNKVFSYIFSKLGHIQDAEDLTGEVFLKIYEKFDSFDESKASLSTWIYTITRNTVIDYFRASKKWEELPEALQDRSDVEDTVCNEQMLETLANALESLDERERDVIILRFYSGKTLVEIANGLNISYAYIKVLQRKALEKLKVFLENE